MAESHNANSQPQKDALPLGHAANNQGTNANVQTNTKEQTTSTNG